jgi:hypothetical protein
MARLLEFMLGDQKDEWLAARLEDLDHGDIDGICAAARACPLEGIKKDQLGTALGYFENNAPRATSGSASAACSSAPASSKPAARRCLLTEPQGRFRSSGMIDQESDVATLTGMSQSARRSCSGPPRHYRKRTYGAKHLTHRLLTPAPIDLER